MLAARNISVELGGRTILSGVSFVVNPGEVFGVVGPNGSGKTTLLRVLAGELPPGEGAVASSGGLVGYLRQGYDGDPAATVVDAFPAVFTDATARRLEALSAAIAVASGAELAGLTAEYDRLLAALSAEGARSSLASAIEAATDPATPVSRLSGGEVTRLALADLLAGKPGILLLDEPTNNLDVAAIEWLEDTLARFPGPAVVVSHDRAFLDAVATHILELDHETGTAELFAGDYSAYANEKARRTGDQWARYRVQQRHERQIRQAIQAAESRSRNIENRTIDFHYRKRAKKVARQAVTLRARLERQAAGVDHVERPREGPGGFAGRFATAERSSSSLVSVRDVALAAGGRELFGGLSFEVRRGQRLFIEGVNGAGKTTLLRAILGEVEPLAGEIVVSSSAQVGYLAQEDAAPLGPGGDGALTPIEVVRRALPMTDAEASNLLHRFIIGHDHLRTPLARLSYGERRRLGFATLVISGANLLVLDEPTNHLDIPSREAFEAAFESYDGAAIVVTHDRYFLEQFATEVVSLSAPTQNRDR